MAVLVVAAMSARLMAEAAARDGFEVVALDLFGDTDTRRASLQWLPIGEPAEMRVDPARVMAALHSLAGRTDVTGWVVGSGFDGQPDLLAQGAALLPLLGTPPRAVQRLRDAAEFFGVLDALGVAHPEVRWTAPRNLDGWLLKDAHGCGGWHIRRAAASAGEAATEHHHFQREVAGVPMSATFIANGREARLLGYNELIVRPVGTRPFVYCGVVGPVPCPEAVASRLADALDGVVAAFSLRGLGSLDFMLDGDQVLVLEVNPRLPASMALYPRVGHLGVMQAHLRACQHGELPPQPQRLARGGGARGNEIVFARRPLVLGDEAAQALALRADIHDQPPAGSAFGASDPVCSLSASGPNAGAVRQRLQASRDAVLNSLEATT